MARPRDGASLQVMVPRSFTRRFSWPNAAGRGIVVRRLQACGASIRAMRLQARR
jgi:hypothetical protein